MLRVAALRRSSCPRAALSIRQSAQRSSNKPPSPTMRSTASITRPRRQVLDVSRSYLRTPTVEIFLGSVAVLHWWRKPRFVRISVILVTESPLANRRFGERVFFHRGANGEADEQGGNRDFTTCQHGLLCDPRKQEEILNDLWVEWLKLALELERTRTREYCAPSVSPTFRGRLWSFRALDR